MQTVRFNSQQWAIDWRRQHHRLEQQQYRNFKAALDAQVKPVIDWVHAYGVADLSAHLTVLVSKQPMQAAYMKCYTTVGVKQAGWILGRVNSMGKRAEQQKDGGVGFFSQAWHKLMSLFYQTEAADRVQGVTDTTRDRIQQLLDESQSLPISERATYIETQLDSPDFNRNRALVIARTETTTAANKGAFLGADDSDYETGKGWVPIMDMNTRPDHADMDGSLPIAMDEAFEVGSLLMQYPGDMSAPAREVVNCRCALVIVPLIGVNGLPVLKVR